MEEYREKQNMNKFFLEPFIVAYDIQYSSYKITMTFIKLLELKDEKLKEMNQRVIIVLHQHSILQIYTYNCSSN